MRTLMSHVPEAPVGVLSSVAVHLTGSAKCGVVQSITDCEQSGDVVVALWEPMAWESVEILG